MLPKSSSKISCIKLALLSSAFSKLLKVVLFKVRLPSVVVTNTRDLLVISERRVGSKLVMEVCGEEGNIVKVRRDSADLTSCLSDDEALALATLALGLDRYRAELS